MNKKLLIFGIPILMIGLVVASLLTYYGQIQQDVNVVQGLTIDGFDWDVPIVEPVTMYSLEEKTIVSVHYLENIANVDATVILDTSCSAIPLTGGCNDITSTTEYILDARAGASGDGLSKRVTIIPETPMLLSALSTISWDANVIQGYMPHVDVFLSNEETLIFEGAKSTANGDMCDVTPYLTGEMTTFGVGRGEVIDDTTYAWQNGNIPGPCGDSSFEEIHKTLLDWKAEYGAGVSILRFEVEVDNWIPTENTANSNVWNITINSIDVNEVTVLAGDKLDFQIVTDFPKMMKPATYTITTEVQPVI